MGSLNRILFFSDLHLPVGPIEPIRPEMRAKLAWMGKTGQFLADHLESRLRLEAKLVRSCTARWLKENADQYDLLINGGDNALPLSRHQDRIEATEEIWRNHLNRYGENRYVTLTGNHELGHGYDSDPKSFEGLLELRSNLFSDPINRKGYGYRRIGGITLLVVDSELLFLGKNFPSFPAIRREYDTMRGQIKKSLQYDGGLLVVTHNTTRTIRHFTTTGLWQRMKENDRQVVIIGGHYHMQRFVYWKGARVFWAGGGSYPEPVLRWVVRVPFTGFLPGGAGAVEVRISSARMFVTHRSYGIRCGFRLPTKKEAL